MDDASVDWSDARLSHRDGVLAEPELSAEKVDGLCSSDLRTPSPYLVSGRGSIGKTSGPFTRSTLVVRRYVLPSGASPLLARVPAGLGAMNAEVNLFLRAAFSGAGRQHDGSMIGLRGGSLEDWLIKLRSLIVGVDSSRSAR